MFSFFVIIVSIAIFVVYMTRMPGKSFAGRLPPLSAEEESLAPELRRHVEALAGGIGSRSVEALDGLRRSEQYIVKELQSAGLTFWRQEFRLRDAPLEVSNFEVELRGEAEPQRVIVVGAHYDSVGPSCPGANDNATSVAAVLVLAKKMKDSKPKKTLRFLLFVNEEPPYFQTEDMGSAQYVRELQGRRGKVEAMLSLETMGYFSDEPGSQKYPFPFSYLYPSTGNFIGFVGNLRSAALVRRVVGAFRTAARIPSEGVAAPAFIPGIGWSDQAPFWRAGIPALMVTDTAPFRYPYYHTEQDTPDKIDYSRLARVVAGLEAVILDLVQ